MSKQKTEFKLIGLSAGNRCTIQVKFDSDKDWFHAYTNFTKDRFRALFDYFKKGPDDAWRGKNIAVVEHEWPFRIWYSEKSCCHRSKAGCMRKLCLEVKAINKENFYIRTGGRPAQYCIECQKNRYLPFDLYQFLPQIQCIL